MSSLAACGDLKTLWTMNLQLEDKLAFVSGSTAGIGFAIAKALAAEGARVIINGRTDQRAAEAISSLRASVPKAKLDVEKAQTPDANR